MLGPITVQGKFDAMSHWIKVLRAAPINRRPTIRHLIGFHVLEFAGELAGYEPSNETEAFYKAEGARIAVEFMGDKTPIETRIHINRMIDEGEQALLLVNQIDDMLTRARTAFAISRETLDPCHRAVALGLWSSCVQKMTSRSSAATEALAKLKMEDPDVQQEAMGILKLIARGKMIPPCKSMLKL